jgi:acyl-CoA synthetase (NDP forming)
LDGISQLAVQRSDIEEIDINPLVASPEGDLTAVDALIIKGGKERSRTFLPKVDEKALLDFFHPRSIAFVGASSTMGKWGHNLFTALVARGYEGEIYLVNPKGGTIADRKVYPSVGDIPGPVDLGVVTIPAKGVMDLIPLFAEKGIRNMLLVTSGYGETGEDGKKREEELVYTAREVNILVLGPNTMGICNPHINLYCTGSHVEPQAGSTMVIAQSGNMGTQLLAFAEQQGIGIRGFAGSGNEAMIAIEDYMDAFENDPLTRIIMLYLESVKNGKRFFESAKRIGQKKPVILLKGGRTEAGGRAAATHTGAMGSDSRVFNAVCRQAGIVKVEYPMDLLDLSAAFSSLPLPEGKRVGIVTLGGGWGVVASDLCAEFGLEVPALSEELVKRFDRLLPPYWSRANPVDLVGETDNELSVKVTEELLKWDGCDAVINLGMMGQANLLGRYIESIRKADPACSLEFLDGVKKRFEQFEKEYVKHVVDRMEKYNKPVIGVGILTSDKDRTLYRVDERKLKGVFYPTPERAVKALANMVSYRRFLNRMERERSGEI